MKSVAKFFAAVMAAAMIIGTFAAITPVSAAKGVDIYLDELSMSSYLFKNGTAQKATYIGERYENPGEKPWYVSNGQNILIESKHTIGGHEPQQGVIDHSDFTWDISAFAANSALPFSAQVCKAGGGTSFNAEYIVLVDGQQVWTSGVVTDANGLITVTGVTIPKGAKTLTLRADRGTDNDFTCGEYHWVDAKITLPSGLKVTRMETRSFTYVGDKGPNSYYIGAMYENNKPIADFWDPQLETWRNFTTKNLISGHQNADGLEDAHIEWDISDLDAGYFTVVLTSNWPDKNFNAEFSILVDGQIKAVSNLMYGYDGLWRGTVEVPADAKKLTINVNNGTDTNTCGAFSAVDPIFVSETGIDGSSETGDIAVPAAIVAITAVSSAVVIAVRKKKD